MSETILGVVGTIISFALWLPQASLVYANRNQPEKLTGLSKATMYLVLANALCWGAYALLTGAFWAGAPGLINGPLAIAVLVVLHRRHGVTDTDSQGWRLPGAR